jgi:hypothetical protein
MRDLHYVRKKPSHARKSLLKAARRGGVTLVLGAGVSVSRGVPSWESLVRSLWQDLEPPRPLPDWLEGKCAPPHPLAHQILLEEMEGALRCWLAHRRGCREAALAPWEVENELARRIARRLYTGIRTRNPSDTLGILSDLLRVDQKREKRRVLRVLSFNADDLLEAEANRDTSVAKAPVLWPVPRASFHPRMGLGANDRPPIPVYHLHGFLPHSPRFTHAAPDTLVFTDAQYWESVEKPASFANRIMSVAMQDSRCMFIGLSMRDVNLMRWLGLRSIEFLMDRRSYHASRRLSPGEADEKARQALDRHYWICTKDDDPSRFIASHLERRGVTTVALDAWGEPFEALMRECFVPDDA